MEANQGEKQTIYAHTQPHIYTYSHTTTYRHIDTYSQIFTYQHIATYSQIFTYSQIPKHTHIFTHIHIHPKMHTYPHIPCDLVLSRQCSSTTTFPEQLLDHNIYESPNYSQCKSNWKWQISKTIAVPEVPDMIKESLAQR